MSVKELLQAELEFLSEDDLQELYELAKRRSQRVKDDWDEFGALLERCQIETGITDLAEQHHHYIHGTPKIGNNE
ncbi:MAG: hypothetical protein AAGA60_08825 [Cyanobacteria bacterium P01_E01_bin.42]